MEQKKLLAHSARFACPEQSYQEHISEVVKRALESASKAAPYTPFSELFVSTVRAASEYHDLGKLDETNQKVLSGKSGKRLKIDHCDAGTAHLLLNNSISAAICVLSHHNPGLRSIPEEKAKAHSFRIRTIPKDEIKAVYEITDERLKDYIKKHESVMGDVPCLPTGLFRNPSCLRFALSCLVDADHSDTARHYGREIDMPEIPLLAPIKRLTLLDSYVHSFPADDVNPERLSIRQAFYDACRIEPESRGLYSCRMPVGSGKTTSVMAHLLMAAARFELRKIFVVLPFTSIIDQSVKTYRQSLVMPIENPEAIIAAHHHRAEYKDPLLMAASFLWDAPVTVTTAVQFFETLASNMPTSLRKLHNLAGAAIFIDEAHAALRPELWPQAWKWLLDLVQNWGCHIVLGSGSLSRFWELSEFSEKDVSIPEISGETLFQKASDFESNRVAYPAPIQEPMGIVELSKWITSLPGPRIVVMNTVQSAAALARKIAEDQDRGSVEHLSTAIAPIHRELTLDKVEDRLKNKDVDNEWTLVSTTCAEAGLNFSFHSAARELSSLASLIQIGGRVNRQGEYGVGCQVWSFRILEDDFLRTHRDFISSAKVLEQLFNQNKVNPTFCTEAMRQEIREKNRGTAKDNPIVKAEKAGKYPDVAELFKVIDDSEAFTVVIDSDLKKKLDDGDKPSRKEMQSLTVRMRKWQIDNLGLSRIKWYDELFFCPPEFYDPFLGYMRGVLQILSPSPESWVA